MKVFLYSDQIELFKQSDVVGFGDDDFYVKIIGRKLANEVVIKNHYSHKITNHSYIHLGVFIDKSMVGVLQAGYALNPASGSGIVVGVLADEFCELNRMWLDDGAPRNSESKSISYLIKYIKKVYPKIKFIMSFADERCNLFGVVYQAANFSYYGEHTNIFWELDDVFYHNIIMSNGNDTSQQALNLRRRRDEAVRHELRQFRYIYWIQPKYKKLCLLKEQPYPKNNREE